MIIQLIHSTDSDHVSVRGYLLLIQNDSITHMHGFATYVKEGLPFAPDLSLENSVDSTLCFRLVLLQPLPYFCFLYQSPRSSSSMVFDSISSIMDDAILISPPVNSVHHKDWLTYSGGTNRPSDLVVIFLSQMTLLRELTFLLGS